METSVISNSPFKIKLHSKKLESGKFQVKFYATRSTEGQDLYGYVLVDPGDTLKRVVTNIKSRLSLMEEANEYYHTHLFAVGKTPPPKSDFMIFKQ